MRTYEEIKEEIVERMKEQGTYSKSYSHTIELTAQAIIDYDNARQMFEDEGSKIMMEYTNKNGSTNQIKNPLYLAIEKLRSDIEQFEKGLGLSPTSKVQSGKTKDETTDLMRFISE